MIIPGRTIEHQKGRSLLASAGKMALRGTTLFLATEAFLGARELYTDARVFSGTLPYYYATDLITPLDAVVGAGLTAIQLGGLGLVDNTSHAGLQDHQREIRRIRRQRRQPLPAESMYIQFGETFFKHAGTVGTVALTGLWLTMAGGMTALALSQ